MKRLLVTSFAIFLLLGASSRGSDGPQVEVRYVDGEYRVQMEALLHASPDLLFDILTDYASWPHISDLIVESEVEEASSPSRHRVRTRSRGCILAFCKTVEQVQWVTTDGGWSIEAAVVPQVSDFRLGWARTELSAEGTSTRFRYEMVLVPDFWIPPVIGPAVIRHKLREEAIASTRIVEALAHRNR